ncbi:MAG: restriction endonuclease subunit S [Armatimonadetes bacterium]|nr:restriction endonuclease subunit S [Akkermansiaceae bacterium]
MKKSWISKPLADLCEVFTDGNWIESKDQSPKGIRLIQTGNVGQGVFKDRGEKARYISEATFKRLRCTEIFEGDCLVSRLPDPVGRSCILPDTGERMITAVDCSILRFTKQQMLPTFFNFYSQSLDYLKAVDDVTTGTTRNRISRSNLGSVPIPIPPLAEQQRIVGLLDDTFEGIATAKANAEKNLQNARALFESHLQSVFFHRGKGWVEEPLESVSAIINGFAFKSTDFSAKAGLKCIKITNVGVREFVAESGPFLPSNFAVKHRAFTVTEGNIVIALTRTIIAGGLKVAVVPAEYDGALLNQRVASIIANHHVVDGKFLFAFLSTQTVVDYVKGRVNTLMQPNLSIADLRSLPIPLPPLSEQIKITNQIDALREETQRLATLYTRKLAALEALKKSLLHQAFSGEL